MKLNSLSDHYRLSLKYCLEVVYFELIVDNYELNETSMVFSFTVAYNRHNFT